MPELTRCSECGSPLPDYWPKGLCPQCALDGALEEPSAATQGDEAAGVLTVDSLQADAAATGGQSRRFGDYELLEEVARGGMGVIYRARQVSLNRIVALKMILAGQFASKQEVLRFRSEAEAAATLQHPNIVRIHETGERDGHHYFSMDYVEGRTLADIVRDGPLPALRAAGYARSIAETIHYAHSQGVLHRDLKPSNVIIDGNDQPRITDFGLAKRVRGDFGVTVTGQALGSPNFMPPEQTSAKSGKVGPASDVYGIGAVLYCLLTGRPPFHAETIEELLLLLRDADPVSPRLLNPSVPQDLETICLKCLEKDPGRRYPTAQALADELNRFQHDEPIEARPLRTISKIWRWCRRRPAVAALSASVLLLLFVVTFGSNLAAWRVDRARRAEQVANRDLRQTVSLLELGRAEDLFRAGDSAAGVAHLAAILRRDPSNHIAASRLASALVHRNWALPAAAPMRHFGPVETVCFSPDGRRVLSASRDGTASLLDATTGERITSVRQGERILQARFSPDGSRFVTASADGTARIWNTMDGSPRTPALTHTSAVYWAEFSADGRRVVTASADRTTRVWDAASGAMLRGLSGHSSQVVLARFSPDGARIATGGSHGSVRMWNAASGEMLFQVEDRAKPLTALAFSPDGRRLLSACADGIARIWNASNGLPVAKSLEHKQPIDHAAFSPDSRLVLTASQDNTARLWDAETGQPVGQPLVHDGGVIFGAFSHDSRAIVTTSSDNSSRLWDVGTGTPLCQPLRQHERILHADFSPDGRRLVTASYDWYVQLWDIRPRRSVESVMPSERGVTSVSFSPDGKVMLTSAGDRTVRLWNARTGQPLCEPVPHSGPVHMAAFSPDGSKFVTASTSRSTYVRDTATGATNAGPFRHAKGLYFAGFSPEGERLVTASADGTARIWNIRTGQPITPPLKHQGEVRMARFSPNGRLVVTASEEDHSARVWDAQTGQPMTEPLLHVDHVKWAEFSPDNANVITASTDNTACIWAVRTGRQVVPPLRHARIVEQAVFSPDGRRVATASLDRTARVWDSRTGQAVTPPLPHGSPLTELSYSPDGRRILTGCWRGLRLWDSETGRPLTEWLDTGEWVRSACFDVTGQRVAAGARSVCVWEVPPAPIPASGWFPVFAEAIAGIRLDERGNVDLVPRTELDQLARRLPPPGAGDFYERLARWFLSDPAQRASSPF